MVAADTSLPTPAWSSSRSRRSTAPRLALQCSPSEPVWGTARHRHRGHSRRHRGSLGRSDRATEPPCSRSRRSRRSRLRPRAARRRRMSSQPRSASRSRFLLSCGEPVAVGGRRQMRADAQDLGMTRNSARGEIALPAGGIVAGRDPVRRPTRSITMSRTSRAAASVNAASARHLSTVPSSLIRPFSSPSCWWPSCRASSPSRRTTWRRARAIPDRG